MALVLDETENGLMGGADPSTAAESILPSHCVDGTPTKTAAVYSWFDGRRHDFPPCGTGSPAMDGSPAQRSLLARRLRQKRVELWYNAPSVSRLQPRVSHFSFPVRSFMYNPIAAIGVFRPYTTPKQAPGSMRWTRRPKSTFEFSCPTVLDLRKSTSVKLQFMPPHKVEPFVSTAFETMRKN